MSKFSLELPVAMPCGERDVSHRFLQFSFVPLLPEHLVSRTVMYENTNTDPQSLIQFADMHLQEHPQLFPRSKPQLAAAACLMSLCVEHKEPQLEIEEKVIAVAEDFKKYNIERRNTFHEDDTVSEAVCVYGLSEGDEPQHDRLIATVFYLPGTLDSSVRKAVMADRGGANQPVLFGIDGSETLLLRPFVPRTVEKYFPAY